MNVAPVGGVERGGRGAGVQGALNRDGRVVVEEVPSVAVDLQWKRKREREAGERVAPASALRAKAATLVNGPSAHAS